jgi:rare lipoprotein A
LAGFRGPILELGRRVAPPRFAQLSPVFSGFAAAEPWCNIPLQSNPQPVLTSRLDRKRKSHERRRDAGQSAAALSLALAVSLIAACATSPPRSPAPGGSSAEATVPARPAEKAAESSRRGGYYLDDGPGENPPPNLEAIPDAEPRIEPLHRYANNPYTVFGQEYVPDQKIKPYKKRGVGSWYGRRFHGQKTSSGEPYDMYAMTAAHPTLPIPSYARVTSLANGKSVVVRVNDRGPFLAGRLIDLSYAAAYKLGYAAKGSGGVEVRTIPPEEILLAAKAATSGNSAADRKATTVVVAVADTTPPDAKPVTVAAAAATNGSPARVPISLAENDPLADLIAAAEEQSKPALLPTVSEGGGTYLQLGAFSSRDNAESFLSHLTRELAWAADRLAVVSREGRHRVCLGPYSGAPEANRIAQRVRDSLGFKPMLVQR